MYNQNLLTLFKSLFQGRQDVYAVRWEKDGKSGYMPAYKIDWSDYNKHKAGGGTFKDYSKKEYLPFGDDAIHNHLSGKETIGVYPLLEDNSSHFIAADFDEENWKASISKLYLTLKKLKYLLILNDPVLVMGGIYGFSLKKIFQRTKPEN